MNRQRASKISAAAVPMRGPAPPHFDSSSALPFAAGGGGGGGRDSDASLCSSRPSSAGGGGRPSQSSALLSLNDYLSRHSASFSLKPPLPSARDIIVAFRFLLSRLDFPLDPSLHKLEDDLPLLLKLLACPIKLNKSALKAPGTPHSWPSLLSVLHWLHQLAEYSDHLSSSSSSNPHSLLKDNRFLVYLTNSYSLFMNPNTEDEIRALDEECQQRSEHQVPNSAAVVDALKREAADLEAQLRAAASAPSRREALEGERTVLMEDIKKFQAVVDSWGGKVAKMEAGLGDLEKELEAKERESRKMCEENGELQRRIDAQAVNVSDAERMRRELQAVERDVVEAETGRNAMEEMAWELEAEVGRKFKELETLMEQCNQAIRK